MKTVEIVYRYGTSGEPAPPADADAARIRLDSGNQAFAALLEDLAEGSGTARRVVEVDASDLGDPDGEQSVPMHRPFAAVIGCSDARVPIELIFNEGPNDLFVMRVAGNSLGNDVLGSLEYAIDALRNTLRLVVVLGHSGCGALTGAVDAFLNPRGYLPLVTNHALRSILDRQLIVVQSSARALAAVFGTTVEDHGRYREALIETSIAMNAALTAHTVQQELGIAGAHSMRAVYGIYLLQSHEVWSPRRHQPASSGLIEPPADAAGFVDLAETIVTSSRIAALLGQA